MTNLLSCPFCGGEEVTLHNGRDLGEWVSCRSCGLEAPSETGQTKEQAIEYWNRRAAPVPQCDAVTAEDIRACAWSTLIGWQDELGDSIDFICDQIARKATLVVSSADRGTEA